MNTIRTFIAIELNSSIKNIIQEVQDEFKQLPCDVKWVNIKNIHLTLKFLGNISKDQVPLINNTLVKLIPKIGPVETQLTEVGAFPRLKHPRVIWIGLNDDKRILWNLARDLDDKLNKIGFPKEERGFKLHITLGRIRSNKNLSVLGEKLENYQLKTKPQFMIDTITFFKSILTPSGPIYDTLKTFSLTTISNNSR